jgi:hypothetical protein
MRKDLGVALEDRPGALAEMGEALGRAGVSIEGGGVFVTHGVGIAHFLFADGAAAREALDHDHQLILVVDDVGVSLLARMRERGLLRGDSDFLELTYDGETWLAGLDIEVEELRRKTRPLVRSCLDWSERRSHLAGAVGAALLTRLFELRFARRDSISRAVMLSTRGEAFMTSLELGRR